MSIIALFLGLALLFWALGFDTSIPDVAARIKAAFTPATSWRFVRAVLAALLILVAAVSAVVPRAPSPGVAKASITRYEPGDAKSVYQAVAEFQKAHGLAADGVVGSKTCPLLYKTCPVK